jgi:hypothetical protein
VTDEAVRVLRWCLDSGAGLEIRPEYPGLPRCAVVVIRGGLRERWEAETPMQAWVAYQRER